MGIWTRLFGRDGANSRSARCSACSKVFGSTPGGIAMGDMDAIAERINSRPTYCEPCAKHFCIGCAFKAAQSKKLASSLCCPQCGGEVPQNYTLPS